MNAKICALPLTLLVGTAAIFSSCSKSEQVFSAKDGNRNPGLQTQTPYTQDEIDRAIYIPGSVIVKFTAETADAIEKRNDSPLEPVSEDLGLRHMERLFPDAGEFEERSRAMGLHQYYIVDFDTSVPLAKAQSLLESVSGVESFEKRNVICLADATNDAYYSYLWEYSGTYSIHVEEAWEYTTGDPSVVVCVVDEGVQLDHEDLAWNCGSVHYNFVANNSTIVAGDHGTHVAGTIAAVGNNGKGIAGIAGGDYARGRKGTTIISSQVFQGNSSAYSFQNAIKWGADNGAVISQNSWGNSYDFDNDGQLSEYEKNYALNDKISASMAAAIDYFIQYAGCDKNGEQKPDSPMKGGVVVFAAGNDGLANGVPAHYEPVIAVGSTGRTGRLSTFSNYGDWADICAPGEVICSCVPSGQYAQMNGTSMACPHVSGGLALLLAMFGKEGFTNEDLTDILLSGANPDIINCSGKSMGPYLDLLGSLEYGIEKYKRADNNAPVIETSYDGDFRFRQWENVSIEFTVSDPDGDRVEVTSEVEGRAKIAPGTAADTYVFTLMCELVTDFTPKKAKITATDMYGGICEKEFTYQVVENQAPFASGFFMDAVMPASGELNVSADGVFEDPDDEPLSYTATVSPSGIVKVSVDGNTVKIQKQQDGLATVTVTAKDYMGAKASASFKVLSRDESSPFDYYPNPVKDFLNIRTSGMQPEEVQVRISPVNGSAMFDGVVSCSAFEPGRIDMTNYAPGQYTLKVNLQGKEYSNMIVKR
ncbi:MAG: S8 family serine peptidase [Bacteroidales bacterium]|nr:S8 family serine peptidase [Bacteroidales bacterium]